MLDDQHQQVRSKLANSLCRPPWRVLPKYVPIFPPMINESITPFALSLIREQWEMAIHPDFDELTCTGNFGRIYGLPCCHNIARSLRQNNAWVLDRRDIDIHWYFERPQHMGPQPALRIPSPPLRREPTIREPLVVRSSGRPRANDVDRTTRRDPSHWELPPTARRTQQDNETEQPSSGPPVNQAAARGRGRGSGRPPGRPRGSRNRGRGGQSQVRN
jgi:hypothetical protein